MVNFHCISSLYWAIYNPRRGGTKKRAKSKRKIGQTRTKKPFPTARLSKCRFRQIIWKSSEINIIAEFNYVTILTQSLFNRYRYYLIKKGRTKMSLLTEKSSNKKKYYFS